MRKIGVLVLTLFLSFQLGGMPPDRDQQLKSAKEVAKEAGKKLLEIRNSGQLVSHDVVLQNGEKARQTSGGLEVSQFILDALAQHYPTYGFLSQDHMEQGPQWHLKHSVWIINAIDGTKEFEKGKSDFHIQIGLLEGNDAVVGVSYYPATDIYVWAVKGEGAWMEKGEKKQRLKAALCSEKILIHSSSHALIEGYLEERNWKDCKVLKEGLSSTSRLLKIIQGKASLYISLGPSPWGTEKKGGVWNYAANIVIANEAGVFLTTLAGDPLNLRQPDALLPEGLLITNDVELFMKAIQSNWHLNHLSEVNNLLELFLTEDAELDGGLF